MRVKIRWRLGVLLVALFVAALVPAAALAEEEDDYYNYLGSGWCHSGNYGSAVLADRVSLNRVASVLGLTSAKLTARLRAGDTVTELAAAKNIDLQKVVDAALGRHNDILQRRVEYGDITQSEADAILKLMQEQTRTSFEEGSVYGLGFGGYGMGPGMMGGWGQMGGMMGGFGMGRWGW